MITIIKRGLKQFICSSTTQKKIFFHLILLSFFFFLSFYQEHQKLFHTFAWDWKAISKSFDFSQELSSIGKTLPEQLFSFLIGLEFLFTFFLIPPLFWNCFENEAKQGTLESVCASPLSCGEILRLKQIEISFSMLYFLLPTFPFYFVCFTLGLGMESSHLFAFLFLLSFCFFYAQAGLYFAVHYTGTQQEKQSFYGNLFLYTIMIFLVASLLNYCLQKFIPLIPLISLYLILFLFYSLGSIFYLKQQVISQERIRQWLQ